MADSWVLQPLLAPGMCQALGVLLGSSLRPSQTSLSSPSCGETWKKPGDSLNEAVGVQKKPSTQPVIRNGFPEQTWVALKS